MAAEVPLTETPLTGTLVAGMELGGRYRVERQIGAGGFGSVYAAVRSDGARAAVKVLSNDVAREPGGEARFRREAELAQRLTHPNSVRVLDHGRDASGSWFIAFELLEGQSLDAALAAGPMHASRVAAIAVEVLGALEEAHAAGIIHRDLKPANVFLCAGPELRVKVLDFGIAKSINPGTVTGLTRDGTVLGTPAYMAPEQIAGMEIGPRADLYALGIVIAELLHGGSLYPADATPVDILRPRLLGEPLPLSAEVAASPLAPILLRATAHSPDARYASAAEMRAALTAELARLPAPITPAATRSASTDPSAYLDTAVAPIPTMVTASPRAPRRRPIAALLIGAFVLVALACGAAVWWSHATAKPPPKAKPAQPKPPEKFAAATKPPEELWYTECTGRLGELGEDRLRKQLEAGGWAFVEKEDFCAGELAGGRCNGVSAKALRLARGTERGRAVVLLFAEQDLARDYKHSVTGTEHDVTFGYDDVRLLRLDMTNADAHKILDALCPP